MIQLITHVTIGKQNDSIEDSCFIYVPYYPQITRKDRNSHRQRHTVSPACFVVLQRQLRKQSDLKVIFDHCV